VVALPEPEDPELLLSSVLAESARRMCGRPSSLLLLLPSLELALPEPEPVSPERCSTGRLLSDESSCEFPCVLLWLP
jgi:hypothetical protein